MDKLYVLKLQQDNKSFEITIPENITIEELENIIMMDGMSVPENTVAFINASKNAQINYSILPDWLKTWTADEASQYVHDNVLNGLDVAGVDAYVDNLPSTVAGMKTGLKQIGGALVSIRDILEIIAKLLMYIRDLVIRFRE